MAVWLWAAFAGCTEKDGTSPADDGPGTASPTADTGPVGEGTLAITFAIDPDRVPYMTDPPAGPFWGSIYDSEDVSSIGPDTGAVALAPLAVADVTLPADGTATAVLATTGPLPAIEIAILGFVDTDGNASPTAPEPDDADPVTLPHENRFQVIEGQETVVSVYFGLLNP